MIENAMKKTQGEKDDRQATQVPGERVHQVWTRNDTHHDKPFVEQWRVKSEGSRTRPPVCKS